MDFRVGSPLLLFNSTIFGHMSSVSLWEIELIVSAVTQERGEGGKGSLGVSIIPISFSVVVVINNLFFIYCFAAFN